MKKNINLPFFKLNMKAAVFLLIGSLIFMAISCDRREEELLAEVQRVTQAINHIADITKKRVQKQGEELHRFLEENKLSEISTKGMDQEYKLHGGVEYIREVETESGVIYYTGLNPLTETIKKRMKRMEGFLPFLRESTKISKYTPSAWYDRVDGIVVSYPYANYVALLAPGLGFENMHWMYLSGPKHNPNREVIFVEPPFFTLGDQGLIIPVNGPVYENGEWIGMQSIDIRIPLITRDFFKKNPHSIFWMTEQGDVVGMSPAAQKILKLKSFERIMWLNQGDSNRSLPEYLKLSGHAGDLGGFFKQLKSKGDRFQVHLFGKQYIVQKRKIPLLKMYVIGLIAQ